MGSIYQGPFKVSQIQHGCHDGLDLVGDNKNIYSNINGTVVKAGWESQDHSKGFGKYVKILKQGTDHYYYFGHLSQIIVEQGNKVRIGERIGIEGSTGRSTGSHCHFCVRIGGIKKKAVRASQIIGIQNKIGSYKGIAVSSTSSSSGSSSSLPISQKPETGQYKITATKLKVRTGAGTLYHAKDLSDSAHKEGDYVKGVVFNALAIVPSEDNVTHWWAKTPSGYVCLIGANNESYATMEKENATSSSSASQEPKIGDYQIIATKMKVRTGPGIDNPAKAFTELSPSAQKQSGYVQGIVFTAQEIIKSQDGVTQWWAKTPSGYVCLVGKNNEIYAVRP